MSEALLRELANQLLREQFYALWPVYLSMAAIALVVGFTGSYFGSYAKKRGEALATKSDFDFLLTQVKATTVVAEEVKASVAHADWATREQKTLRRIKLEELLHAVHEVQAWQELDCNTRLYDNRNNISQSPLPRLEVIAGLYFPELQQAIYDYGRSHGLMSQAVNQAKLNLLRVGNDLHLQQEVLQSFANERLLIYQEQLGFVGVIQMQARKIMRQLVGL
ncbi:hypothetical protein ACFQNF_13340 [Iodobacter arcticus]|uniref:Uncharacterized protein n=1 Tax=Iodobacter arcticus TaxID=590593 RepID=A0ABW2R3Q9_9NEIS